VAQWPCAQTLEPQRWGRAVKLLEDRQALDDISELVAFGVVHGRRFTFYWLSLQDKPVASNPCPNTRYLLPSRRRIPPEHYGLAEGTGGKSATWGTPLLVAIVWGFCWPHAICPLLHYLGLGSDTVRPLKMGFRMDAVCPLDPVVFRAIVVVLYV
jgi:hypothetical protein